MKLWKWLVQCLLAMLGIIVSTNCAYAQLAYQHAWFSVDVGSAVSNEGDYSLRGVAGQADAGELRRDAYVLTGGVLAVSNAPFGQPPDAPPDTPPDQSPGARLFMPKLNR